jgi:hypothetical protein
MGLSHDEVKKSLETFELKPGVKVRLDVLKQLLPDASTALFFGKVYELNYRQLSNLLLSVFNTTVIKTLLGEGDLHSTALQDYIIDVVPAAELQQAGITAASFTAPPKHELLPALFEELEVTVAASIKALAEKLGAALEMIQVKQGSLVFSTLHKLNRQRDGAIGTFEGQIKHKQQAKNLVIFDVSGSMTRPTVEAIVDEVVALTYKANASLAIVSNNTFYWAPGTFNVADVMAKAEFGGTHYETLASLLNEDWATVITIADYDSAGSAQHYLKRNCTGHIQQVLDISLVNQNTFLAECVGQLADTVRPLLVGNSYNVLGSDSRW